MGSYNVACSISSLSIGPGTKIAFFPLLPNSPPWGYGARIDRSYGLARRVTKEHIHRVGCHTNLIYSNCYFNPLCLPVFGEYDDYGGVENIEEDSNTKALEEFFGMSIDDVIASITCLRDPTDTYSHIYSKFAIHKDEDFTLGPELLEKVGFHKMSDDYFTLANLDVLLFEHDDEVGYRGSKFGFELINQDKVLEKYNSSHEGFKELCYAYQKHNGYYVNYPENRQKAIKLLTSLSGMFVHRDVYEGMSNYPKEAAQWGYERTVADGYLSEDMLQEFGFEKIKEGEGKEWDTVWAKPDQPKWQILARDTENICVQFKNTETDKTTHHYARIRGLKKHWKEYTGEDLDISKYEQMSKHLHEYREHRDKVLAYEKELAEAESVEANTDEEKQEKQFKITRLAWHSPYDRHSSRPSEFIFAYREWNFFKNIYDKPIKNNVPGLGELFDTYHHFDLSMIGSNRFYFPAKNGEQCGNLEMSKHLLEVSMKIVNDEFKERENW